MSPADPGMRSSSADLLVLHTVRVIGVAEDVAVAARTGVDLSTVAGLLRDHEAYGWIRHVAFAGIGGWTLTARGRVEDVRRLRQEVDDATARSVLKRVHQDFEPLNSRLVKACTEWQLRPVGTNRLSANDHTDLSWDARVLADLSTVEEDLGSLLSELVQVLPRFEGYDDRFASALATARQGQSQWVAGIGIPSCHVVWMELHEDLLSTLGVERDGASHDGASS